MVTVIHLTKVHIFDFSRSVKHTVSFQAFGSFRFFSSNHCKSELRTYLQSFFVKSQHSILDFCHLTSFLNLENGHDIFYDFKPSFLLEAGQILERSQWIQILWLKLQI